MRLPDPKKHRQTPKRSLPMKNGMLGSLCFLFSGIYAFIAVAALGRWRTPGGDTERGAAFPAAEAGRGTRNGACGGRGSRTRPTGETLKLVIGKSCAFFGILYFHFMYSFYI